MRNRVPANLCVLGAGAALGLGAGVADAYVGVHAASSAARAAILRAFVKQDGSAVGVRAVLVANADHHYVAVCVKTPDAGRVGWVFKGSGRSWRYVTNTLAGSAMTNPAEARLTGACLHVK